MTQTGETDGRADGVSASMKFEDQATSIADIKWIDGPAIVVFWILAIIVFLQFFTRYVLNNSLAWTEEAARYLLILVCFLGSISAMRRGTHIMLEFLIRMAPAKLGKAMAVFAEFITFGFLGTLTWIGIELTQKTRQQMITMPIPKAWVYTICVIALGLMTIYSAIWLWRKFRASPSEIHDLLDHSPRSD